MAWMAALLAVLLMGGCTAESTQSCVGPRVTVTVTSSASGTKGLDLQGQYFVDGCSDTGGHDEEAPLRDIPVLVGRAASARERLATVDASGSLGVFQHVVDLPPRLQTGTVEVAVGDAEVVRVNL